MSFPVSTQINPPAKIQKSPRFPGVLSFPLSIFPQRIHSKLLVIFLNRLLAQQIKEGELDFLEHRRVLITLSDVKISYGLSLENDSLMAVPIAHCDELKIQASLYDFLILAARHEDADTLVFQRRLLMQGDTELGLELKNFLDGLDIESAPAFEKIESLLQKSLPVYRRLFS
ncbi:hypothetical protein MNBD_GAMMA09-1369 [hydrothermal vent metagenome]|uniref:SCP2 domain-containing protein n=1 Tax=hydrothermal vent metagenome TaxID=652676 RepID=A0A3B0XM97_9ZZZZ